jgi:hypothetical protein
MTRDLRQDIVDRLAHQPDTRSIAALLLACREGHCGKCGDVCPIKADRWTACNAPSIERALANKEATSVWKATITHNRWVRTRDDLAQVSLGAIEKAIRRSLDALRQPQTTAVGIIDAWYSWRQWEVGAKLLIAGPSKSELFDAFPSATLQLDKVTDLGPVLADLLQSGRTAKRAPPFDADGEVPGTKRRGEYYAWLTRLTPGSRIIRYGCDRYFNLLKKARRPGHPNVKKGHPSPTWLAPHQYGSHSMSCDCWVCQRRRY